MRAGAAEHIAATKGAYSPTANSADSGADEIAPRQNKKMGC